MGVADLSAPGGLSFVDALPEGLLLGPVELSRDDVRAMMRRHGAATGRNGLVQEATPEERWEILRAVVWPSDALREAVAAIDAGERANF